ncbi:MAG: hypothetical protein AAF899_19635 [Pseudomonadota bacterium]
MLSGCVAAALVAGTAVTGGTLYSISGGGEASYEVAAVQPAPAAAARIGSARSVALYPSMDGTDGQTISTARARTDLEVVSATKTVAWVRDSNADFAVMTSDEKATHVGRLAAGVGADLGIFAELTGQQSDPSLFVGNSEIIYDLRVTMVAAGDGDVLWSEPGRLRIRMGAAVPGAAEITRVRDEAIADRVMQIRREATAAPTG